MARFAILGIGLLALVVRFVYDRLSTLGLFRGDLAPVLLRARSASPALKFIDNTINAEDLHFDPESGLIYAAVQDADGSRSRWFPALGHFEDPAFLDKANGGLAVIDPVVSVAGGVQPPGAPSYPHPTPSTPHPH
jgi:hypothetical protein